MTQGPCDVLEMRIYNFRAIQSGCAKSNNQPGFVFPAPQIKFAIAKQGSNGLSPHKTRPESDLPGGNDLVFPKSRSKTWEEANPPRPMKTSPCVQLS